MLRRRTALGGVAAVAVLVVLATPGGCQSGGGAPPTVKNIRVWHDATHSRIVLDADQPLRFKVTPTSKQVVIDLPRAHLAAAPPAAAAAGEFISGVRQARGAGGARLIFTLRQPARYRVHALRPQGGRGHRLVVDFSHVKATAAAAAAAVAADPQHCPPRSGKWRVLIDAGHGGKDPGALGARTQEKVVALQIARRLKARLDRLPDISAALTRTDDRYLTLRRRTRIAHRCGVDLFVSMHADAAENAKARGASVYVLSERGASSEAAQRLAERENAGAGATELIGGERLADMEPDLAETWLDLALAGEKTLSKSEQLGAEVLAELGRIGELHSSTVERAAFVVLKLPNIPAILVETAYISNRQDEALLTNKRHQERLAAAVAAGISRHLKTHHKFYANQ